MRPPSVYVADDHPIYREAVVAAINACSLVELVGSAEDGEAALAEIIRVRPDVAVLDVHMPGLGGPEVMRRLSETGHTPRVLFVTGLATAELATETLAAGARGVLDKQSTADELCAAVIAVARGEQVLSPRLRDGGAQPLLTAREREVLALVARGMSAPGIAEQLVVSPHTVKTHLRNTFGKLAVTDRAAAVAAAMRRGLL